MLDACLDVFDCGEPYIYIYLSLLDIYIYKKIMILSELIYNDIKYINNYFY